MAVLKRVAEILDVEWVHIPAGRTLGGRLKAARQQRGWSQVLLAEKAGVSIPAIGRVERDRAQLRTLGKVLDVLAPDFRPSKPRGLQRTKLRDVRFTPPDFLAALCELIGPIDLDPAADPDDYVMAKRKYFREDDGLVSTWEAGTVFCNPPYSCADKFIRRAHKAFIEGEAQLIVMLVPSRTHALAWVQCAAGVADILLLTVRMRFWDANGPLKHAAPFGSALIIYGASPELILRAKLRWPGLHVPRIVHALT